MSVSIKVYPKNKKDKDSQWMYEISVHGQIHTTGIRPSEREARRAGEDDASIAAMFIKVGYEQVME